MSTSRPSRRRLLAAVGGFASLAGVAPLAGCLGAGGSDGDDEADRSPTSDRTTGGPATAAGATATSTTDGIDTLTTADSGADAAATTPHPTPSTQTATPSTTPGALDLREANVTDVAFERADGAYRLSVTLYHDDDGEDGYANWWQVEALDGTALGRRELLHAHGTREFTRSETVEVPAGTPCVVVRGHDQTHGYGGQAMLVTLETGATRAVRQGEEPQSFADAACP